MCDKFYDCSTILGGGEKGIDRSILGTQSHHSPTDFVTASNLAVISHSGRHSRRLNLCAVSILKVFFGLLGFASLKSKIGFCQ